MKTTRRGFLGGVLGLPVLAGTVFLPRKVMRMPAAETLTLPSTRLPVGTKVTIVCEGKPLTILQAQEVVTAVKVEADRWALLGKGGAA